MNDNFCFHICHGYFTMARLTLFIVMFVMLGCRKDPFPDPKFINHLDRLRQWTKQGWDGYSFKEEEQLLDDLCRCVQSESNGERRVILYAQFTNVLVNVPFFSTNGIQRGRELPRGLYRPPYWYRVKMYRSLLERAQKRELYTNRFDSFCLGLEIWKRLCREQNDCPRIVETWMKLRYEDCPSRWIEADIRDSMLSLSNVAQEVERTLEGFYYRDSDESRRAYELFRNVIGREARPCYKQ